MRGKKQPVTWNGIEYPSIRAAAQDNGYIISTFHRHLDKGYTCDEDVPPHNQPRPVTWNGISYPSIGVAAKANGITKNAMKTRIFRDGYSSDADMQLPDSITWNGIEYENMSDAARALGISRQAMHQRIQKGYTCDEDIRWGRNNKDNTD